MELKILLCHSKYIFDHRIEDFPSLLDSLLRIFLLEVYELLGHDDSVPFCEFKVKLGEINMGWVLIHAIIYALSGQVVLKLARRTYVCETIRIKRRNSATLLVGFLDLEIRARQGQRSSRSAY